MQLRSNHLGNRGATLIEVMVAVTITSIGLLGMAGLMTASAKVNHGALEHTQASIAAQSLVDSMHINPIALQAGAYDGRYEESSSAGFDCRTQACAPVQAARYDRARFTAMLGASLPQAHANVQCNAAVPTSDGMCRLQIDWSQHAQMSGAESGTLQTLVWLFVP